MVPPPLAVPFTTFFLSLPLPLIESLIADLLTTNAIKNDTLFTKGKITRFHAKDKPELNLKAYLHRLIYYTPFPIDSLLLAIIYLNRISSLSIEFIEPTLASNSTDPPTSTSTSILSPSSLFPSTPSSPSLNSFPSLLPEAFIAPLLSSYTIHRLLLSTLLVSTKFTSDYSLPSAIRTAKVAGVGVKELARLEGEILGLLRWNLGWEKAGETEDGAESEVEIVSRGLLELGEKQGVELIVEGLNKVREKVLEISKKKEVAEKEGSGLRRQIDDQYLYEVNLCPTPPLPNVIDDAEEKEEDIRDIEDTPPSSTVSLSPESIAKGEERKGSISDSTEIEVDVAKKLGDLVVVDEVK